MEKLLLRIFTFYNFFCLCLCSDITSKVFGSLTDGLPAAFGDFNSDELTDVFVIRDEQKTMEIFLANEEEPLLRSSYKPLRCSYKEKITSVVPGDFDGDAYMDVLVTTIENEFKKTNVYINWGGANHINCSNEAVVQLEGQPLAIDYNQDMIIDLFGLDHENKRAFWIFNNNRTKPEKKEMKGNVNAELATPHAHAFLDLNNDNTADLFITTEKHFEVWFGQENKDFVFNSTIPHPKGAKRVYQSLFIDVELRGRMDLVTPICYDEDCEMSALMVYADNDWHNLQINFKDLHNINWKFYDKGSRYGNTVTLRSGDFNMDGYPDLLVTLSQWVDGEPQTFMLENVACDTGCGNFTRTYAVQWNALNPFKSGTVMGTFFDFYQDGILDVILVQKNGSSYKAAAFKNTLDYDANFVKVMVLTGLNNDKNPMTMGRVGKKRRTYGTNLPGPTVSYKTTTQEGNTRHAMSSQLPQSAHFSLNLPYNIFGLGRAPNFVEIVTVGLSNHSRLWTQIIPNSQIVIVPWPPDEPSKWKAQLFVTPSKLILMSVAALTGVCCFIIIIIGALHWKERQDDKKERLSESNRFHFDAM